MDLIEHCGNRRQPVDDLVAAWNRRANGAGAVGGVPDDPLIRVSVEPKRRTRTPLTPSDVDAIRTARAAGVSVTVLAREYEVHRSTIWQKTRTT